MRIRSKFSPFLPLCLTFLCLALFALPMRGETAGKTRVLLGSDMVEMFDDGIAMLMLLQSPQIELMGVTIKNAQGNGIDKRRFSGHFLHGTSTFFRLFRLLQIIIQPTQRPHGHGDGAVRRTYLTVTASLFHCVDGTLHLLRLQHALTSPRRSFDLFFIITKP